jgi:hypothetical protein
VPQPGQPGAEYYHQGADALSISRWFDVPPTQTAAPPATPPAPSEEAAAATESSERQQAPAAEQGPLQDVGADDAGLPADTQVAAVTVGQDIPPPSARRPPETPPSASPQASTPAARTPQRSRVESDARIPLARNASEVLEAYTLASLLPVVAALLLAMLVAVGVWAFVHRHE